MSQYPSFRGEASANEAFMDFQSGNSDATKVAQPIQQVTQASHDISAREIVVITQTDKIKQTLQAIGYDGIFGFELVPSESSVKCCEILKRF